MVAIAYQLLWPKSVKYKRGRKKCSFTDGSSSIHCHSVALYHLDTHVVKPQDLIWIGKLNSNDLLQLREHESISLSSSRTGLRALQMRGGIMDALQVQRVCFMNKYLSRQPGKQLNKWNNSLLPNKLFIFINNTSNDFLAGIGLLES